MSAPAYARRGAPAPEGDRQPRLFALPGGASATAAAPAEVEPRIPAPRPTLVPVPSHEAVEAALTARAGRTLDSELRLAWTGLRAGAPVACIMCGGRMEPHAHAPGGACTDCGTTLD